MKNIFLQFWEWLTGRKQVVSYGRGEWAGKGIISETGAAAPANPSMSAEDRAALPLGWRFRPASDGYSMSVGQLDELNRLLRKVRPLPQGAMRVLQELNAPDASASSVAEAIGCEPVMAAGMVRIANSTAMGLRREITAVSDAVAYLGFSTTKSLLLKFSMDSLLPSSKPGHGYDSGKLWVHAMAVAQVAEEVARRAGHTDSSLALTAGLLHDIGKLAINNQFRESLDELWSPNADPAEDLLSRERRLFQADHAIIGGALAKEWKLPHDLIEIIRLHHMPYGHPIELEPEARRALYCVHIANQLVKHRHAYCDQMEIDEVPAGMTSELGLPTWDQLLADAHLLSITDRMILLNSGAPSPAVAA